MNETVAAMIGPSGKSPRRTFRSVPASGQCVVLKGVDTVRIAHGQIVEHWGTLAALDGPTRPGQEENHGGSSV